VSLAERLATATFELVAIASESGDEAAIVRHVRDRLPLGDALRLADDEDTCLLAVPASRRPEAPLVLFAGHLDTVPAGGAAAPRREGGVIHGRGAADQKAGVAAMLALAEDLADGTAEARIDAAFLFFGREEIATSALAPCLERHPELAEVALAVVTEPTDNALEVGCLGNLQARVTVRGTAAHSARPWLGRNAIHDGIRTLAAIADLPVRDVEIDGLTFREVVNVTTIAGGVAANVIPDALEASVNLRYAPTHTPAEAEARIRELLDGRGGDVGVEVLSNAPGGPVTTGNPLVQRLRALGELEVRPKQAWTPVAEFAAAGIDAVNLGPGDPGYAHRDDELVREDAIVRWFDLASALLRRDP
jgi:succinyl-diaminopimelate desuccinylase